MTQRARFRAVVSMFAATVLTAAALHLSVGHSGASEFMGSGITVLRSTYWPPVNSGLRYLVAEVRNDTAHTLRDMQIAVTWFASDGSVVATDSGWGGTLHRFAPGEKQVLFAIGRKEATDYRIDAVGGHTTELAPNRKLSAVFGNWRQDHFDPEYFWLSATVTNINDSTASGVRVVLTCNESSGIFWMDPVTHDYDITLEPGASEHIAYLRHVNDPPCQNFVPTYDALSAPSGTFVARTTTTTSTTSTTTSTTSTTAPPSESATRLAGADRIETSIAISNSTYPEQGSAGAAILSRADGFADALAGTPLADRRAAPILLTGTAALDPRAEQELRRVLAPGGRVFLLGGPLALGPEVEERVTALGYQVERVAGPTRYDTAAAVAERLGHVDAVFLATGTDFADALSGGAAAAAVGGAILLTDGSTMPPATRSAAERLGHPRYALGGPAAKADPTAIPIVGTDRYATAAMVAERFAGAATVVGVASGESFADALGGGAHVAELARGRGPLLLTRRDDIPEVSRDFISNRRSQIATAFVYGGTAVVSNAVLGEITAAMN